MRSHLPTTGCDPRRVNVSRDALVLSLRSVEIKNPGGVECRGDFSSAGVFGGAAAVVGEKPAASSLVPRVELENLLEMFESHEGRREGGCCGFGLALAEEAGGGVAGVRLLEDALPRRCRGISCGELGEELEFERGRGESGIVSGGGGEEVVTLWR